MTALFLSPHNDDETLFGAFTLLRHKPKVLVCLRSDKQENVYGFRVTSSEREAETDAAMKILGCEWEQWPFLDSVLDWTMMAEWFTPLSLRHGEIFAPAVEDGGHEQHNHIGEIADIVFGVDRVTHYMTYTNGRGRSTGVPVPYEREWVALKLRALACYESQIRLESTGHHFVQGLEEWYAA